MSSKLGVMYASTPKWMGNQLEVQYAIYQPDLSAPVPTVHAVCALGGGAVTLHILQRYAPCPGRIKACYASG
jgi:hypothetical protein